MVKLVQIWASVKRPKQMMTAEITALIIAIGLAKFSMLTEFLSADGILSAGALEQLEDWGRNVESGSYR